MGINKSFCTASQPQVEAVGFLITSLLDVIQEQQLNTKRPDKCDNFAAEYSS